MFNFLTAVLLRSTSVISAFVIFLITSYLYGPEGRGTISFLTAFYASAGLIMSAGLGQVVYQRISLGKNSVYQLFKALTRSINFITIACMVILVILYVTAPFQILPWSQAAILNFLIFVGFMPYSIWQNAGNFLFSSVKKTKIHDKVIFVTRCLQLLILLASAPLKLSLSSFIFIYGLSGVCLYFIEVFILLRDIPREKIPISQTLRLLLELLKEAGWSYLDSIALALNPLITFVIGIYISKIDLGHYNFAIQMISAFYFPFAVLQIKIQERLVATSESETKDIIRRIVKLTLPVSIGIMTLAFLVPYVLPITHLSSFLPSVPLLKALIPTIPIVGINSLLQGTWIGLHRPRFSSLTILISNLISIFVVFLFIQPLGIWVGVVAIYIGQLFRLIVQGIYLRKSWSNLLQMKIGTGS